MLWQVTAMRSQEIAVGRLKFAYERYEGGKEIFVLIHGWCSVRGFWSPVLKDFRQLGTCINLDLAGHYPATTPADFGGVDLVKVTALQAAAIQQLAGKKKVTVVGHSTGGLIALSLALHYPQLVKRVVAIGPVIHGPVQGPLGFARDLYKLNLHAALHLPFHFIRSVPDVFQNIFETGVHRPKTFFRRADAAQYVSAYREQLLRLPPEVMGAWLTIIDNADLRPALSGSKVPTLFITGAQDKVVSPAQAREIARRMPRAAYHEYAQSGHIPILEEEAECFENLKLWLSQN